MAKSFYEFVEHKIVDNFDFDAYAKIINEHVAEKGYVTPEEMHEAFERLRGLVGGAARVVSGLGNVAKGVVTRGVGSGIEAAKSAGSAIGGAVKGAGSAIGGAVKSAGGAIAQAGKDFGGRMAADYQSGVEAQSKAQINAHLAQVQNQPWFLAMPKTQQDNILRAYRQTA